MFSPKAKEAGYEFTKDDINELYYMINIDNLGSILEHGILSHSRVEKMRLAHGDVSNAEVQARRADKYIERTIESKKPLSIHEHANLYINPHNAMMYVVRKDHKMCVLRISKTVLERGDAIISNRNASTHAAAFFTPDAFRLSPTSTEMLVSSKSTYWEGDGEKRKQVRQSEVLLPYEIAPTFIIGVIARTAEDLMRIKAIVTEAGKPEMSVKLVPSMFFDGPGKFVSLERFSPIPEAKIDPADLPDSDSDDEKVHLPIPLRRVAAIMAPVVAAGAGAMPVSVDDLKLT